MECRGTWGPSEVAQSSLHEHINRGVPRHPHLVSKVIDIVKETVGHPLCQLRPLAVLVIAVSLVGLVLVRFCLLGDFTSCHRYDFILGSLWYQSGAYSTSGSA